MLLAADGFDSYASIAQVDGRWTRGTTSTVHLTLTTSGGRGSGGALECLGTTSSYVEKLLASDKTKIFAQAAIQFRTTGNFLDALFQFRTNLNADILTLTRDHAASLLQVRLGGSAGTVLATGTTAIGVGYHHIAIEAGFHASTGHVSVMLNGVPEITFDGLTEGAAGGCRKVRMGGGTNTSGNTKSQYDDVVFYDDTGSFNNAFIGDATVKPYMPVADTVEADFTPSAGTDNFAMVDEALADGDTTYVESPTIGHRDLYEIQPGLAGVVIVGVQVTSQAKGGGSFKHLLSSVTSGGSGATEADGPELVTDASVYKSQESMFETDPDTSALWTAAGLDLAEIGVEVTA